MVQKKSYSRYFIILQEDEKGYALAADKAPTGYAKLETKNDKCKVSFYVQNLKKESAPYYMVLICNKKEFKKIIELGKINIDEFGRADVSLEYSADNIAQSGISTDKISGAAIVRYIDANIIAVMDGFSSVDIPEWRKFSVIKPTEENREAQFEEKVEEKSIFDKYEENIQIVKKEVVEQKQAIDKKEIIDQKQTVDEKEVIEERKAEVIGKNEILDKDLRSEEKTVERDKAKDSEDTKNVELNVEENNEDDEEKVEDKKVEIEEFDINDVRDEEVEESKEHKENDEEKEDRDYPIGEAGEFFKNLVDGFEEITDVSEEIKRCRWYKVSINDIEDMMDTRDYNRYTVIYYPLINYYPYIKKHGHYLIGHKCDNKNRMKYLVYAIPGTKSKSSQPYGGKSGFVTWIPLKNREEDENSMGYWLMFYDFRTSTIVIPVK